MSTTTTQTPPPPGTPDITRIVARLARLVVPDDEAARRRERAEQGEAATRGIELWNASQVPARHADKALHPPQTPPGHAWVRTRDKVMAAIGRGVTICLTGTRGNGKTQIAVDAILKTTLQGRRARFVTAARLFAEVRGAFGDGAKKTEVEVLDGFRRPKLLVIDEIGQRADTAFESRILFELLNARYNDMTDTILTANLDPSQLVEALGPSLVSRMTEGGGVIHCTWASFRGAEV